MDSDKQVVSQEVQSGSENAPMVVEDARRSGLIAPVREADKEVVSSWQTMSREENAPIPVESEEEDIKSKARPVDSPQAISPSSTRPPPSYDSLHRETSGDSSSFSTHIEPDGSSGTLPTRTEDRTAVGQLLAWMPLSPHKPREKVPRLDRPVVIPQLDVPPVGESVPFQRCYSDVLAAHDVSMREFVSFLDGLSVAQAPTSALQGVSVVGRGLRMVPIPFAGSVGRGISALASSGSGKSGSRAKLYVSRAMQEYFAPRGLRVSIVKDEDLATQTMRMPPTAPRLAPLSRETLTDTICTRRLNAIRPYSAELRWDVPEPDSEVKQVDKLARKHLQYLFSRNASEVARMRDEQWSSNGKAFEGALQEEKRCSRLRWLVVEQLR